MCDQCAPPTMPGNDFPAARANFVPIWNIYVRNKAPPKISYFRSSAASLTFADCRDESHSKRWLSLVFLYVLIKEVGGDGGGSVFIVISRRYVWTRLSAFIKRMDFHVEMKKVCSAPFAPIMCMLSASRCWRSASRRVCTRCHLKFQRKKQTYFIKYIRWQQRI